MSRLVKIIVVISVFVFVGGVILVQAQDSEIITGGQAPEKTFNEIIDPVINLLTKVFEVGRSVLEKLLNVEWLKNQLIGAFDIVNGWIYDLFDMDIGEILATIGNFFVVVFEWILDLARKIWPF